MKKAVVLLTMLLMLLSLSGIASAESGNVGGVLLQSATFRGYSGK